MGGGREVWEELCTFWADAEVRHCLTHSCWELEKGETGFYADVSTDSRETNSGVEATTLPEWLREGATADWTTGGVDRERVITNQGVARVTDVVRGEDLDHNPFRLLLERAGYETW